jgi:hypothetical protein
MVYVVIWEYENANSGVSAIFDNEEAANEYKHWCEHKNDYNNVYHVVKFVVGTKCHT